MLLVEIISHLNGHIAIDHEAATLVRNSQIMQSSSKSTLPSSLSRGIDVQVLERLCDILYCRIPALCFQDFKGFGRNSIFYYNQVSNANVAMKMPILD
jgi:hypothetical protein